MSFSEEDRTNALLWCDRHCCQCKKQCGVNIEVHHIVPEVDGGDDDIENAIPLCFDCHCDVGGYCNKHPIGNKYKAFELRKRRDQVYEEFTRHLVPPIHYEVTQVIRPELSRTLADGVTQVITPQLLRILPDTGFNLTHIGDALPVSVRVSLTIKLDGKNLGSPESPYYNGKKLWHLNPRFSYRGHFRIPSSDVAREHRLEVSVDVTVIDCYAREHRLLPVGYVYTPDENHWYFEP